MPFGRGPSPEWLESLITARDVAYRAGQEAWIMPTNALETFDIIVLTPGEFQNTAVMAVGRGRWFLSTYFKSELMKPEEWDFFAALVRWERENKEFLVNAWQFGGKPEDREAYGFMFRNAAKDLYCVRNPWIEQRAITLPPSLVATEAREVRMIYPRRAALGRIEPGSQGLRLVLGPYETMLIESVPAAEGPAVATQDEVPRQVALTAGAPRVSPRSTARLANELSGFRWDWTGVISTADGANAELCVLVEGRPEVSGTLAKFTMGGREVTPRRAQSAGQFGAALDPSPENWTWFIVPLSAGDTAFEINLTVSVAEASIGAYVRGAVAAPSEPAPEVGAVFPTFHADRRPWSQTLAPLRAYALD